MSARRWLPVVVLLASCLRGAKAPVVTPQRTLDLGKEGAGAASSAPFAVVFAGPRGEVDDPSEVTVVFNRPMRPLELAGDESAPPASIVAAGPAAGSVPRGAWRWMGTQALVFVPDPALARATEYTVTIPAGTKALDGTALAAATTFTFATPRPKLVRTSPPAGDAQLVPGQAFELRFDQPIALDEVERGVTLRRAGDGKAKPIGVRASYVKSDVRALIKVTPRAPLPLGTRLELVVDGSLHGTEGPRPAGDTRAIGFSTYGPLAVKKVDCWRETPHKKCAAYDPVRLELTNRVAFEDLKAHVKIDPPVPLQWPTTRAGTSKVEYVGVPARLLPGRTYKVIVTAGLKDEHGQVLGRDATFPVEVDDLWPAATLGLEGTTFEAVRPKARAVPVTSVNLGAYELATAALDETALAKLLLAEGGRRGEASFEAARALGGARVTSVRPQAATNVDHVQRVGLEELLVKQKGRGAAFLGLRWTDGRGQVRTDTRIVALTDLAVSARMSKFGGIVWVTHLSTGRPAAGALVTIRGRDGGERFVAKADVNGIAAVPADGYAPIGPDGSVDDGAVVVARDGDDWTFQRVSETVSSWRYDVPTDLSGRLAVGGLLFTDRGVYRPGETVRMKGIFRKPTPRGTETPRGGDVHLVGYDGSGEKVLDAKAKLDAFGEIAFDLVVPSTAHLGQGELRAELEGDGAKDEDQGRWTPSAASASFLLAAYKAAEFKVGIETDKPSYVRGDKAAWTTRGDYLFGAPMTGGHVRTTVTRSPGHFAPPGSEELVLDDDTYARDLPEQGERAYQLASAEGALDGKGGHVGAVALALPNQRGTELVTVESEVEDVSRQVIAGRTSAVVHPAEFYAALAPPKEFFTTKGTKLRPEVRAVEPSGHLRPGVRLDVQLVRRTWHTVVEADGEGTSHYQSRTVDAIAASCAVTSAANAVACDLTVPDAGYFVLRVSAKDRRGNPVAASAPLYAMGEGADIGWAVSDAAKVDLVTDKKSYEVGDVAKVLVKNPFREAEALVTIERAGVYRKERVTLRGPTPTLDVPITDDMRPNAFVAVHVVRGRTAEPPAKGQDVGAPAYRLGYANLVVNPEARRLRVLVTPSKKDARPGDTIDVDLAVTDRRGAPARSEVTFYVVDEGVLMLTGYQTPDPIPVFSAARPLAVFALEGRDDLARIFLRHLGEAGVDKGGEGGGGGEVRSELKATAYFEPGLVTGTDGKAKARFKLPDNLTTFRLMAVAAAEDDRFGFGESQVVSSRRLMARPALPRFLRAGDALEAGVVVSTKGLPAGDVEVTLTATGLEREGEAKRVVSIPAGGSVEVRWPMAARAAGKAKLRFTARALRGEAGDTDVVEVTKDVAVPLSLEAVALAGETTGVAGERLGDLSAMRADVGGLDVKLASTALVGVGNGAEQLLEYPYGCTEQLTSKVLPMIPLRQLAADFGVVLPKDAGPMIGETLGRILKAQQGDGGFGYWSDSPASDPWLSAWVLFALDSAKKHGHSVPDAALEGATRFVRRSLERRNDGALQSLATRAFMIDVLAEVGSPDPGYANRLYDERAKLPLFARALLAHAMTKGKMDAAQIAELLRGVEQHLRVTPTGATVAENVGDEYAPLLDSSGRTTAMVLRALVAQDAQHPLAARLARGLLGMRDGGKWRSTQEAAWALLALDDYRRVRENVAPDFEGAVFAGPDELFAADFRGRSAVQRDRTVPAAQLFQARAGGSTLAFQVRGRGTLFYEARLRYAKKELPQAGLDRGFYVQRLVRAVRPEAMADAMRVLPRASAAHAQGSDLVLVDLLVVTAQPREQVVIDDPLPAGLEPVDASLATSARSLDVSGPGGAGERDDAEEHGDADARAGGTAYGQAYFHREMKDDRVLTFVEHMPAGMYHYRYLARATTFGTFVVPPTRAECMYEPEIFGRTGATTFEVRGR